MDDRPSAKDNDDHDDDVDDGNGDGNKEISCGYVIPGN